MVIQGQVYKFETAADLARFVEKLDELREQMLALMDKGEGPKVNPKRVGKALYFEHHDVLTNRDGFIVLMPGNFGWADTIPDEEPTTVEDISVGFFVAIEQVIDKTKQYLASH